MRFGPLIYAIIIAFFAFSGFQLGTYSVKEHSSAHVTRGVVSFPYFHSKGSSQKLSIFTRQWTINDPKAIVFIAHGFGEHSGRYNHVAQKFNEEGYSVYALDHIGHGKSDGDRCHVEDFQHYTDDLLHYVEIVTSQLDKEYPVFLLGHSMGGLIAIQTALQTPTFWRGVIISGPALTVPNSFLQNLAEFLGNYLPKFPVYGMRIPPTALSKDEGHVTAYFDDPLVYRGPMKSLWGHSIITSMKNVHSSYDKATFPFILVHGEADIICKVDDSQKFYDNAPSNDKRIIRYPGLRHEVMNEVEREVVLTDIVNWVKERT